MSGNTDTSFAYTPARTEARILCASCGVLIPPNPANLCIPCIQSTVDITDGIPKQSTVHFCRGCNRYLQPPNYWVVAELESAQLLALCLKKLKIGGTARLVDAGFIWTEPHSRRLKVKVTIQKEVFASTLLQQTFIVEFIVAHQFCDDCARVEAQQTWKAVVQVRQKVPHKRTFLWLEQLILKHNAHKDTTNIKEMKDGIDFYYAQRPHSIKMVDFLSAVVPCRSRGSEQLISSDIRSNTANFRYTYSVEIAPICKDDLVCLPPKLARSLGNINPLCLCVRVSNALYVLDPNTLKTAEVRSNVFFEHPFTSLCDASQLTEFYVIEVQQENVRNSKYALATVEIAPANDLSQTYIIRTHLGNVLRAGDHAMGYLLLTSNFNNEHFDALSANPSTASMLPDVVLVKKSFPSRRRKNRGRNWRLKTMVKEEGEEGTVGRKAAVDVQRAEADYELFLRDLEEDAELRGMVNLYKDPHGQKTRPAAEDDMDDDMEDIEEEEEADFPEISVDELLDDLEGMTIDDEEAA
ncbi:NMD3-domain-containing protein [Cladochytrium replicatum]|nr:NMD3-domain-containing protein [Cladochytrium replicatum]